MSPESLFQLYKKFTTYVNGLTKDELESGTKDAIRDSKDSYLMGNFEPDQDAIKDHI